VPNLQVRDVPLDFEARAAGASKASLRQGLLFLDHLRSLFFEVEGSARIWKFGLVGLSGLAIFLPLLALLNGPAHLPPLVAFVPSFAISLLWNTGLNRLWTFADQRRRAGGRGPRDYLDRALLSGALMLGAFALLTAWHLPAVAAGALSAIATMASNGFLNRPSTRARPTVWSDVATDRGIQSTLSRLAEEIGADRAFILPPTRFSTRASVPGELLVRVVDQGRPALWVEAASHRHQRRTNIELTSIILVPVIDEQAVRGVLICERTSRRPFDTAALDVAIGAGEGVADALAIMAGRRMAQVAADVAPDPASELS
jgi:putative flippase GtrA